LTLNAGRSPDAVDALREWARQERISGDWIVVDQARIDMFARATGDSYWLHTDPARAERESPYRSTIAHGFLLLSLTVGDDVDRITALPRVAHVLNYGLDKVRFLMPVVSGARVRVRSRLEALTERRPVCWLLRQSKTLDIQGESTAALVAEHLALVTLA